MAGCMLPELGCHGIIILQSGGRNKAAGGMGAEAGESVQQGRCAPLRESGTILPFVEDIAGGKFGFRLTTDWWNYTDLCFLLSGAAVSSGFEDFRILRLRFKIAFA